MNVLYISHDCECVCGRKRDQDGNYTCRCDDYIQKNTQKSEKSAQKITFKWSKSLCGIKGHLVHSYVCLKILWSFT